MEKLGISFEAVLSLEEPKYYRPCPEMFHNMPNCLDVDPQEAVLIIRQSAPKCPRSKRGGHERHLT